jgi:hypothetical protein
MPHKVAGRSALSAIRFREPAHESGPIEAGHLTHCPSDATRGRPTASSMSSTVPSGMTALGLPAYGSIGYHA